MFTPRMRHLMVVALGAVAAAAACTSELVVDEFTNSFSTKRNSLGSWTSGMAPDIGFVRCSIAIGLTNLSRRCQHGKYLCIWRNPQLHPEERSVLLRDVPLPSASDQLVYARTV